ncbi:hypothetical protein EVAR_52744_1 [Eumeta japonica]|uniref:Uncharacterized protein n=1 Tax=Eumeta variegata TaxID=151549 RepID=A0A4C1Y2N9_EUMVA|nr:hypothetical protein EVAR_52744_1 [Eumeta japonica]
MMELEDSLALYTVYCGVVRYLNVANVESCSITQAKGSVFSMARPHANVSDACDRRNHVVWVRKSFKSSKRQSLAIAQLQHSENVYTALIADKVNSDLLSRHQKPTSYARGPRPDHRQRRAWPLSFAVSKETMTRASRAVSIHREYYDIPCKGKKPRTVASDRHEAATTLNAGFLEVPSRSGRNNDGRKDTCEGRDPNGRLLTEYGTQRNVSRWRMDGRGLAL